MAGKGGKKSGFDYLAGHEDKQITKVAITGDRVHIAWKRDIPSDSGEKQIDQGSKNCPEPEAIEFSEAMKGLAAHVKSWLLPEATKKTLDEWTENIYVQEVDFTHTETKGVTAKITFFKSRMVDGGKRRLTSKTVLPALPLYDGEIEGHASGMADTYTEEVTQLLHLIQTEAKMYLGGKRGPERKKPGEGALFDGLDKNGEDEDEE